MPTRRTMGDGSRWVNVPEVTEVRLAELQREFPTLDARDVRDCLPPQQRPKFVRREGYAFLILLFPRYLRGEHALVTEEVDIILTTEAAITIHNGTIPIFAELAATERATPSAIAALLEVLEHLLEYCAPILVHIQNDIEEQERHIGIRFDERQAVRTSFLRRNTTAFRRAFGANALALGHLRDAIPADAPETIRVRLNRILDATQEILVLLEDLAHASTAIHETQLALVNFRMNRIMETLTVIATLTFPPALLLALFSMDTVATPIVGHPYDFWIIFGGIAALAFAMLGYFRTKRWL